jgi:DNA-binding MarR family transcriptional regulator
VKTADMFELPCLCANLRRAARLVSQLYETNAGWSGLHVAQFSLLLVIERRGTITRGAVGAFLGLDQTTVSRSLTSLGRKGWIRDVPGRDLRERRVTLTAAGKRELDRSKPGWRRAQGVLRRRYGADNWAALEHALTALAAASSGTTTPA